MVKIYAWVSIVASVYIMIMGAALHITLFIHTDLGYLWHIVMSFVILSGVAAYLWDAHRIYNLDKTLGEKHSSSNDIID